MGSVKDLIVIEKPTKKKTGRAQFAFSDRYSVFDWGEMPDHIQDKGAAICITTAYFFEKLEETGIKTHYRGLVEGDEVKSLSELNSPQSRMKLNLLRVLKPRLAGDTYDYSAYKEEKGNMLIPLEIIYRNSLPEGSSVFRRLKAGSLSLDDIGLDKKPYPGQVLERPLLDVSTKLEASDRYISWDEAKELAGLSESEIEEIERVTLHINELITREAIRAGLINEDGKVEFGFDETRNLVLVDTLGTLDECRFTFEGMPVSKEIARIFYRNTNWYEEVESAKKKDNVGWKELVGIKPAALPPALRDAISMLYKASCNEMTHRIWFDDVPAVKEVLEEIKGIL
ncbi:Phosphoribosylaminoimidazole-succinocarboxamide synthase [ANME-1 cluster archaeon GoMg2]|nr:Phosphoribosylaminoimidazole-succinocarboxamide synthase [ANME-1 cluster archaeon GoMg2]